MRKDREVQKKTIYTKVEALVHGKEKREKIKQSASMHACQNKQCRP
jgi:hypothetical protein